MCCLDALTPPLCHALQTAKHPNSYLCRQMLLPDFANSCLPPGRTDDWLLVIVCHLLVAYRSSCVRIKLAVKFLHSFLTLHDVRLFNLSNTHTLQTIGFRSMARNMHTSSITSCAACTGQSFVVTARPCCKCRQDTVMTHY